MKAILILMLAVLVTACGKQPASKPAKQSASEMTSDKAERIAGIVKILSATATLPSVVEDAFFLEEQTGDGQLGPSDFSSFCVVVVGLENAARWKAILSPISTSPEYSKPGKPTAWWISEQDFKSLEFFKPAPLSTRLIGWVGVSTNSGKIYIHTETM